MRKPLEGIRVFDLTIAAAGPWASMLLGALGAEVIKVERYEGDMSIGTPPPVKDMGILYPTCNFNKKGIMLDLKDEKCMEVARSLLANCDVFVQNMRPGVVDRLGLGYEVIAQS